MKPYTLLLITVLIFSSCGLGKEFNSVKDCYDSVKYMTYDEIAKVWGEPDYRSDVDVNPSSTVQQEQGINANITVTCIWNRPKVKVHNSNCVTLLFNVVELAGGVMVPSTVRGYKDCESKGNSNNSSNTQDNNTPPSAGVAVDSSILINKQGKQIADNEITTKEVAELEKYRASHITETSKISGYYSIENGFSKLDIKDGSVNLNLIGQTYISAIIKKDSPNNYTLYFWEFIESNGLKAEDFQDYSESIPIATIEDSNGKLIFKWLGLYNRVTKKREYINEDTDIKNGVYKIANPSAVSTSTPNESIKIPPYPVLTGNPPTLEMPNDSTLNVHRITYYTDKNKFYIYSLNVLDDNKSVILGLWTGENNPNKDKSTLGGAHGFIENNVIILNINGKKKANLLKLVNGSLLVFNKGNYEKWMPSENPNSF